MSLKFTMIPPFFVSVFLSVVDLKIHSRRSSVTSFFSPFLCRVPILRGHSRRTSSTPVLNVHPPYSDHFLLEKSGLVH